MWHSYAKPYGHGSLHANVEGFARYVHKVASDGSKKRSSKSRAGSVLNMLRKQPTPSDEQGSVEELLVEHMGQDGERLSDKDMVLNRLEMLSLIACLVTFYSGKARCQPRSEWAWIAR